MDAGFGGGGLVTGSERDMTNRIEAFVSSMQIGPDDRVLEIGCGHGVAASLVCERLRGGRYLAVDRSAKMIAAAEKRNAAYVRAGVARFMLADLETLELGELRFDKVFAQRVRFFHDDPVRARTLVQRWLAPQGRAFFEYDLPSLRREN